MPIRRFNVEEGNITVHKKKVTVNNKEDLIDAALIILRKSQLEAINGNKGIRDKMIKLNSEFSQKPTFKLLNIVNMWMRGTKHNNDGVI